MPQWMNYSKDEVKCYHPLCEKALLSALEQTGLGENYTVGHHEMTDALEMDFVIKNKTTGKYLCVIEVKRTPSAVKSMRYQYQAQSYVANSFARMEQPFFVLTNLECSYAFRYDSSKRSVASQLLKPGLMEHMAFDEADNETMFIERLGQHFGCLIQAFANNSYEYMSTVERFEKHLSRAAGDSRVWRSSLALLLYEYIRGAMERQGCAEQLKAVVSGRGNMSYVCHSGARIGFHRIFQYDSQTFYPKYELAPDFLQEMYMMGKQDSDGTMAANIIFDAAAQGESHSGAVATDTELSDMVSVLVRCACKDFPVTGRICDPAAGSGSLICALARGLKAKPWQLWANDINPKVSQLLDLECGLLAPSLLGTGHSPCITSLDVAALDRQAFEDVSVIGVNPPFLSGVSGAETKKPLIRRIMELTGEPSVFDGGMAGLECIFVELLCALAKPGTVCACILPKTHLGARGKAAVAFRHLLLEKLGLRYVFDYPRDGLFEKVVKDTCVVVGIIGHPAANVRFISSALPISQIDSSLFFTALRKLDEAVSSGKACEPGALPYGVDVALVSSGELEGSIAGGWTTVGSEFKDVSGFIECQYGNCGGLYRLGEMEQLRERFKRGKSNNEGAKELLFIDLNRELYEEVAPLLKHLSPGMVNADKSNKSMDVGQGFCHFLDTSELDEACVDKIVFAYALRQDRGKKQAKKVKTPEALKQLLKKEQDFAFQPWQVLIPRAIRRFAQIYYTSRPTYVSTNFFCLDMENERAAVTAATWMTTIFYQLLCEFYQKDQEGARKMERRQLLDTYIPDARQVSDRDYRRILKALPGISFLDFNAIEVREIDWIWGEILWKEKAPQIVDEALLYLEMLVARRQG